MRKHRKTIASLAGPILCVSLLSGCHGAKETTAFVVPDTFDESENINITFWAKNDTNKNQTAVYEQAIEDFQSLYPNVTVNMKLYTDYTTIYNDVITNISTGTTPDVCITYPDHIATYITGSNVVVPLDDLMADEKYGLGGTELKYDAPTVDEIVPQFLEECKLGEEYYALPFMRSTEAVYVNQTYVEKLGYELPDILTWDFIFEVSEAALAKDADGNFAVNGQKVMIPFIYKSTDNMMIQMLKQRGAGYSTDDGEIEIFNDTTKEILGVCAEHGATGAFSTFKISSYPANFLDAGQCIFAIDSTAGATWMGTDAPLSDISEDAIVDFETAVRMVPQYDTENPEMISQGPSICIFNKDDDEEVLASWLFAQYLLSNTIQTGYAETEGYVPVTTKAQQSDEYQAYLAAEGSDNDDHYSVKIQASRLLLEHTDDTFTTPVFNGSASLRQAAGQMIEDVVKAVRRKQTVDDAFIEDEFDSVTSLYRLDQIGGSIGMDQEKELGDLPAGSKALLITLCVAWIGIMIAWLIRRKRNAHA